MGILFFSDLHGEATAAQQLQRQFELLRPERIAFLGDSLAPARSAVARDFLNSLADRITAVAGNCDGDREHAALLFPLHADYALLNAPPHRFFLTHGDRWNHAPPARRPRRHLLLRTLPCPDAPKTSRWLYHLQPRLLRAPALRTRTDFRILRRRNAPNPRDAHRGNPQITRSKSTNHLTANSLCLQ